MAESILKVPKLLGSSNWDLWSIRMEAILIEKGYYDIMTTSISTLDPSVYTSEQIASIKEKSSKACAYIRLALGDGPLLQTRYITDPFELWATLKSLYEAKGFSSEFLICKELINTTLSSHKGNIELYLQNIRRLINSLESKNLKLPEKFIAALVLNNLSQDYEYTVAIITQTIRSNDSINLDQIFSQLIDESKRIKAVKKPSNTVPSNASNKDIEMSLNTSNNTKSPCRHCNKKGHSENKCWIKYPHLKENRPSNRNKKPINKIEEIKEESSLVTTTPSPTILNTKDTNTTTWVLDSGATVHVCSDKTLFNFINPTSTSIKWGNTTSNIRASGIGDISVIFNSTNEKATIKDVLYVPELGVNLLSLGLIASKGYSLNFNKKEGLIYTPKNQILAKGTYKDGVTIFTTTTTSSDSTSQIVLNTSTSSIWHNRLGHIGRKALDYLPSNTIGANSSSSKLDNNNTDLENCEVCIKAKLTRNISKEPSTKAESYLDTIYIDIGGPIKPITQRSYRYYITFLDSATRWLDLDLLKSRANIHLVIETFIKRAELQSSSKIKRLHADNEFKSIELEDLLKNKGIIITYAAPYTKEQNGSAERINRTLFNKVRALLFNSNLAKKYWGEALMASVYLYNRTPNSSINYKTPYELRYNKKPDISNIKTWGSLVFKKDPIELISKLDSRASPYYLIGYGSNQYKLLNPSTSKTIWARDVKIIENKFYRDTIEEEDLVEEDPKLDSNLEDNLESNLDNLDKTDNLEDNLDDLEDNLEEENKPTSWDSFYNQLLEAAYFTSIKDDPTNYQEVLKHPNKDEYLKAMELEYNTLLKNNTWELVPRPKSKPILKGRWVLNRKFKADGSLDKYKARWVVKGYLQKYGINYKETFANTTKPSTYRLLLAISAYLDWEIYQWDIKQAFTNAPIDTEIYVEQPVGFINNKDYVCLLKKALYGLKQSARQWQQYLTNILAKYGFKSLISDTAVFINSTKPIILAIHVDDILVLAKDLSYIKELYNQLADSKLEVSNLGEAKEFLGIEIIRDRANKTLTITQKGFINKILNKYNKTSLKPKSNPLQLGVKLERFLENAPKEDINKYQQEIGSLIYITTFTRPDLAFPINYLARFMANPSKDHLKALDIIWAYLLNTKDYGLEYNFQSTPLNLVGYSDADCGGDSISRRSTTGIIFLLGTNKDKPIALNWLSKLQKTVALSSCEAEYMALKEAVKENLYLNNLIKELPYYIRDLFDKEIKTIYTDSQSAIELAKNPLYHARTKHVDIRYHFVREKVLSDEIILKYHPTQSLLADGLTKPISNPKWLEFIQGLGLKQIA